MRQGQFGEVLMQRAKVATAYEDKTVKLAAGESVEVRFRNNNNPRVIFGESGLSELNTIFSGYLVYSTDS